MMNQLLLSLLSIVAMAGCSADAPSNANAPAAETANVEAVQSAQPANYVNGITAQNAGDKTGPIHLHGVMRAAPPGSKLFLYETEGKTNFVIDSTAINGTVWDFGTKDYARGFYMIGFNGDLNNMMPVILNPDEAEVNLTFNSSRVNGNHASPGSKENEGFFAYWAEDKRIEREIQALRKQRGESSFKERVDQDIANKEAELRTIQADFIGRYPNTYLAKFLTWKRSPFPGDKGKYWSDIDFNDNSIVRSPILNDRIQEFMRTHSGGEPAGFMACIDLLKAEAEENPRVLEFVLYTMLDGFYQSNMEDLSMYILDNYIFDDDCGANLSDVVKQRAQGIVNLQIGKTPPNFKIEKSTGGTLELMAEVKKHEYTLVMFWASWCHKCEQEMPVLSQVHTAYKGRGFGVVGVSVDNSRQQWLAAIESKGAQAWPNVSQLMSWDSPVAKDYRITQTPTLFLLNKKGEIVLKPKRIFEVENFLKQNL
jgi:thiol-disulfide isomerase/thioredoxin